PHLHGMPAGHQLLLLLRRGQLPDSIVLLVPDDRAAPGDSPAPRSRRLIAPPCVQVRGGRMATTSSAPSASSSPRSTTFGWKSCWAMIVGTKADRITTVTSW